VDLALGFRPHTGWTVAVAVGNAASPKVVARQVLALTDTEQVPAQVYHAAKGLELAAAQALVDRAEVLVSRTTGQQVAEFLAELRSSGHTPVSSVVVTTAGGPQSPSSGRPVHGPHDDIAYLLAAHMRMHAAEGELYGEALADALDDAGLNATRVHPRDVAAVAARGLQRDLASLQRIVTALGAPLGPPWRKDEKEATLLAWAALAARQ
jgi:hypothetical protein